MRQYEIAVVLHPDLEIDIDTPTSKIEKIITGTGGKIVKKDNWGKRKLAYKIKKQDWGIYVFYQVSLEPTAVADIDATLRITEEVMRYLIVSLEHLNYINKPAQHESSKANSKVAPAEEPTEKETK